MFIQAIPILWESPLDVMTRIEKYVAKYFINATIFWHWGSDKRCAFQKLPKKDLANFRLSWNREISRQISTQYHLNWLHEDYIWEGKPMASALFSIQGLI